MIEKENENMRENMCVCVCRQNACESVFHSCGTVTVMSTGMHTNSDQHLY